jgi:hypothetical protein
MGGITLSRPGYIDADDTSVNFQVFEYTTIIPQDNPHIQLSTRTNNNSGLRKTSLTPCEEFDGRNWDNIRRGEYGTE